MKKNHLSDYSTHEHLDAVVDLYVEIHKHDTSGNGMHPSALSDMAPKSLEHFRRALERGASPNHIKTFAVTHKDGLISKHLGAKGFQALSDFGRDHTKMEEGAFYCASQLSRIGVQWNDIGSAIANSSNSYSLAVLKNMLPKIKSDTVVATNTQSFTPVEFALFTNNVLCANMFIQKGLVLQGDVNTSIKRLLWSWVNANDTLIVPYQKVWQHIQEHHPQECVDALKNIRDQSKRMKDPKQTYVVAHYFNAFGVSRQMEASAAKVDDFDQRLDKLLGAEKPTTEMIEEKRQKKLRARQEHKQRTRTQEQDNAQQKIVQQLQYVGCDLKSSVQALSKALPQIAQRRMSEALLYCLEQGVDMTEVMKNSSHFGKNPKAPAAFLIAENKDVTMNTHLIKYVDIEMKNTNGTPLFFDLLDCLNVHRNNFIYTKAEQEYFKKCINKIKNINNTDQNGDNILGYFFKNKRFNHDNHEFVSMLVHAGVDPTHKNNESETVLHLTKNYHSSAIFQTFEKLMHDWETGFLKEQLTMATQDIKPEPQVVQKRKM